MQVEKERGTLARLFDANRRTLVLVMLTGALVLVSQLPPVVGSLIALPTRWVLPMLGLVGLIGAGFDLTQWRSEWGRSHTTTILASLLIVLLCMSGVVYGLVTILQTDSGREWNLHAAPWLGGVVFSISAGLSAIKGWWRMLFVTRSNCPSIERYKTIHDGMRCMAMSAVIALLLLVTSFSPFN